jgi:hypothetical protein
MIQNDCMFLVVKAANIVKSLRKFVN